MKTIAIIKYTISIIDISLLTGAFFNPFRILTQWPDPNTNKLHIFKSDNLWLDPSEFIPKDEIYVSIKGNDRKKYYVVISFLPELS